MTKRCGLRDYNVQVECFTVVFVTNVWALSERNTFVMSRFHFHISCREDSMEKFGKPISYCIMARNSDSSTMGAYKRMHRGGSKVGGACALDNLTAIVV